MSRLLLKEYLAHYTEYFYQCSRTPRRYYVPRMLNWWSLRRFCPDSRHASLSIVVWWQIFQAEMIFFEIYMVFHFFLSLSIVELLIDWFIGTLIDRWIRNELLYHCQRQFEWIMVACRRIFFYFSLLKANGSASSWSWSSYQPTNQPTNQSINPITLLVGFLHC